MRLLVTGGRDYADAATVAAVLDRALGRLPDGEVLVVVNGGARGLDTLAHRWAYWRCVEGRRAMPEMHPADWDTHGKAAGHIRNAAMVATRPDACVAFPGGRGTADCLRRARAAGVRCGVVDDAGTLRWDASPGARVVPPAR